MKGKYWYILIIAMLVSCQQKKTASSVAEEFTKSLMTTDFAAAKKHLAKNSLQAVGEMEAEQKKHPILSPEKISLIKTEWRIIYKTEKKINDSTSVVDFTFFVPKKINKEQSARSVWVMRKEKDGWKVDFPESVHHLLGDSVIFDATTNEKIKSMVDSTYSLPESKGKIIKKP